MIEEALKLWKEHSLLREGCKGRVYLDSRGKPTVGIGHLVTPDDNLKVGDNISDERIERFFEEDTAGALKISLRQWKEIGLLTAEFLAALISVNFQLYDFSVKFPNTYQLLRMHKFDQVIKNLRRSNKGKTWFDQTPVRVEDFITAIQGVRHV